MSLSRTKCNCRRQSHKTRHMRCSHFLLRISGARCSMKVLSIPFGFSLGFVEEIDEDDEGRVDKSLQYFSSLKCSKISSRACEYSRSEASGSMLRDRRSFSLDACS